MRWSFLLMAILLAGCAAPPTGSGHIDVSVSTKYLFNENWHRDPAQFAVVQVPALGLSRVTGQDGWAHFQNLPDGVFLVKVRLDDQTRTFNVTSYDPAADGHYYDNHIQVDFD